MTKDQISKIQRSIYESVTNKNNTQSIQFSKSFIKIINSKKSPIEIYISNVTHNVELSIRKKY
jgi:CRISPR/Cas system-associated endoribonuclease Cas2